MAHWDHWWLGHFQDCLPYTPCCMYLYLLPLSDFLYLTLVVCLTPHFPLNCSSIVKAKFWKKKFSSFLPDFQMSFIFLSSHSNSTQILVIYLSIAELWAFGDSWIPGMIPDTDEDGPICIFILEQILPFPPINLASHLYSTSQLSPYLLSISLCKTYEDKLYPLLYFAIKFICSSFYI